MLGGIVPFFHPSRTVGTPLRKWSISGIVGIIVGGILAGVGGSIFALVFGGINDIVFGIFFLIVVISGGIVGEIVGVKLTKG